MAKFMAKIKKQDLYIIGIVIVVIIIIILAAAIKQAGPNIGLNPQQWQNQNKQGQPDQPAQEEPKTTSGSSQTTSAGPSISYQQAIKTYEGRRFQFSFAPTHDCDMYPYYSVFKNNTNIMLDNRSDQKLTIGVDGESYVLNPYSFKIVLLSTSKQLPYTAKISCKPGQNTGTILLQK